MRLRDRTPIPNGSLLCRRCYDQANLLTHFVYFAQLVRLARMPHIRKANSFREIGGEDKMENQNYLSACSSGDERNQ
uniref:Uncharacterized protein n=1 Tax=Picea glauca TaxID=3330 RepID=A0A101LWC9_PICGL|nr:hypothetical protein ABT39_MTgene1681 [Picea glauca]QHR86865.1 hypothetical protein Q903MT_gene872 [Picea sitchensis]